MFKLFYHKLLEASPSLSRIPLNLLESLGTPTFSVVKRVPFPFWSQLAHALYPCHLGKYHKQTAFGFTTGNVINYQIEEQAASVSFEMNRFYFFPGTNIHSFYGPLLFGVGEFMKPHLLFCIIPESKNSHLLEISIYASNSSTFMSMYYKMVSDFFNLIAIKSIDEDRSIYQKYSNLSVAKRFIFNHRGINTSTPTTCICSLYSYLFPNILEMIESRTQIIWENLNSTYHNNDSIETRQVSLKS